MRELWLLTRIRRDDYWFIGDLRGLGPRSVQAAKLTWSRVHAAVAVRLASMQERLGVGAQILSATLTERLDAMRDVLGSREVIATGLTANRADAAGATIDAVWDRTGRADGGRFVQAALADLRLPELPAAPSRSWWRRQVTRLNPFSLDQFDYDPARVEYWRRTRGAVARLELWRVNPVMLAWNLVRAVRQSLVFLVAMHGERSWGDRPRVPPHGTSSHRSDGVSPTAQTPAGDRPTLVHRSCGLAPPACWTPAESANQWERLRCCTTSRDSADRVVAGHRRHLHDWPTDPSDTGHCHRAVPRWTARRPSISGRGLHGAHVCRWRSLRLTQAEACGSIPARASPK